MIVIAGTVAVKPDRMADAVRAATEVAAASLTEQGCRAYRFSINIDDPNQIHLFEEWADQSSLDLHFTTPHFAQFNSLVADVLAGVPTFTRYEASSSGPLFG